MNLTKRLAGLSWKLWLVLLLCCVQDATSTWEYAICTKQNIIFYDSNWNEIAEAASSKLQNLKALTYDTTHDIFYFTDRHEDHTYIKTLKLRSDNTPLINTLIQRSEKDVIEDLVYDFNDDALFFSDKENERIVRIDFDRSDAENPQYRSETFLNTTGSPSGLELDACNRNLYYTITTDTPNIYAVSITKKNSEPICNGKHYRPLAIALDEKNDRLYIADKQKANIYSINSFTKEGEDYKVELKSYDKTPRSLAIDHEYIYYLDGTEHSLRRLAKKGESNKTSEFMIKFQYDPTDIVVRSNFIDAINVDLEKCDLSKTRLEEIKKTKARVKSEEVVCTKTKLPQKTCLHGGAYDENTLNCICKDSRFDGDHCEIDLCYNFCLNGGECSMEKDPLAMRLIPSCSCIKGFSGSRCERDSCSGYCVNNGKCFIDKMKNPVCECSEEFTGKRCEDRKAPGISTDIYTESTSPVTKLQTVSEESTTVKVLPEDSDVKTSKCPVRMNLTYIIIAVCLTLSLLFFLIILLVVHRFHRPMRPKIRKKYVVHKNIAPLTYRPTTEQCEVIIEDCCNMNICETPCFDPKVLQQELNESNIKVKLTTSKKCGGSSKEDKQDLLKNMELNQ